MKISVLCTHKTHPVYPHLQEWCKRKSLTHEVELVNRKTGLSHGDLLFLISCHEIVGQDVRSQYRKVLVIHASDLPQGRGWSPHIWQILSGAEKIVVSLLEAEDSVDSGAIWTKRSFELEGHELWDEINEKLFDIELELMDYAVDKYHDIVPEKQLDEGATFFRKRTPEDSQMDPFKPISEQFDLLRICDPERFPAFFDLRGCRYKINIEKVENEVDSR